MTTTTGKTQCVTCGKGKVAYKCEGCSEHFCFNHLADHRQMLIKQLDEAEDKRNLFQQTLIEQTSDPQKHALIQQINQWEKNTINKIQQATEEARQSVIEHTTGHFNQIQFKLTELTEELRQIRQEEDFNDKTSVSVLSEQPFVPNVSINARWTQDAITVAGGKGQGDRLNQLYYSWGIYVDDDGTVYVADQNNHRIVEWKKGATSGRVVAGGKGAGNRKDQLNRPVND